MKKRQKLLTDEQWELIEPYSFDPPPFRAFPICTFNLKTLGRVSTGQLFKTFCGKS